MAQVQKRRGQSRHQQHQAQRYRLQHKTTFHRHASDLRQRQRDQQPLGCACQRREKQNRKSRMHGAYSLPVGNVGDEAAAVMRRGK